MMVFPTPGSSARRNGSGWRAGVAGHWTWRLAGGGCLRKLRAAFIYSPPNDLSTGYVGGGKRAWSPRTTPLPLDFPLISRQNVLDSLGAYLSSLREHGLVFPGTLRVTPAAKAILDAFWGEQGERESSPRYEDYALLH